MPVKQPPYVYRPITTSNYYPGARANYYLECAVWHLTAGRDSPWEWFNNPASNASTEFAILYDGTIELYLPSITKDAPKAHGAVETTYDESAQLVKDNWGLSPNLWAFAIEVVGIEAEVKAGIVPTKQQRESLVWLTAWMFQDILLPNANITGCKVDRDHILMHRQISPDSRTCPVWDEALHQAMIREVQAKLSETVIPPGPVPPPVTDWKARYEQLSGAYNDLERRFVKLRDAGTLQAAELDRTAAAADIQAKNWRRLIDEVAR